MCSPSYQTPPDANSIHTYNSLILKLLTIYMDIFCMIRVKKNAIMTNKQIKEPKIERETERNEISGPGFIFFIIFGKALLQARADRRPRIQIGVALHTHINI